MASLPFGPRCIGARYGWVCAGGVENGQFASIRVGQQDKSRNQRQQSGDENGEGEGVEEGEETTEAREPGSGIPRRICPETRFSQLGGSIVNSVTLHRPPSSKSDNDVLAVLTYSSHLPTVNFDRLTVRISNNDKTVRIFHLAQHKVLTTLHLDIATNHASISPDGNHLVVVGDSAYVYFYHPGPALGACSRAPSRETLEAGWKSWILSSDPLIAGIARTEALISTSFSPSSLLCAVASQDGSITIFNTRYLSPSIGSGGPSPIVKQIPSSRPGTYAGAVRSVQFSPAPWDLLVWAEHSGRICVADARSNFTKRQVVNVLVDKDELIEVEIQLADGDSDSQRSWRGREGLPNRRNTRVGDPEEDAVALTGGDDDVHAFLSRRFDELSELVSRVRGNSHEWWAIAPSHATPVRTAGSTYAPQARPTVTSLSPSPHSSIGPVTSTTPTLLRDYRERQLERERVRQRAHDPPRRRNSTHPSYTDQSTSTSTSLITTQQHPPASRYPPAAEVGASLHGFASRDSLRTSRQVEAAIATHQRNREHLDALIAEERSQSYSRRHATTSGSADDVGVSYRDDGGGVDITGCTLSRDGSKL